MEKLGKITDFEIFGEHKEGEITAHRCGARIILFDENHQVPYLFVGKRNFIKLPGGGVEEGESIEEGLRRECLEEVGCEVEILGEVGETEELRYEQGLHQFSYCFWGKVTKIVGEPAFDKVEKLEEYQVRWSDLDTLISMFEKSEPSDYSAFFIKKRELLFLEKARELV